MIYKCKMCDGELKPRAGERIVTCEYCGSRQTVPCPNNERVAELYGRADEYRRQLEFDKAMVIYEEILMENPDDAEGHWLMFLCEYGVQYVEDITEGKRVPTINRMQFTSVYENVHYKAALQNADAAQQAVYKAEAGVIADIQKDILKICEKEEPFDIFICYKEGDGRGRRTMDSVLATDIYELLTKEGYKVFFSRVTLDDKFGVAYEPYIFAALQSARIMIVVGTKQEYIQSAWVKNEWSRYLALMKRDNKRVLIPAYKGMEPTEFPEEFAHLQAVDLDELGYQQDLLRGIRKIVTADVRKVIGRTPEADINIKATLERGFLFIEDGNWERAGECMDAVLQKQSWNGQAYLGKLLIALKLHNKEELRTCDELLEYQDYYQKIMDLKDEELKAYLQSVNEESAPIAKERIYKEMVDKAEHSVDYKLIYDCVAKLRKVGDYKDALTKVSQYTDKAEQLRLAELEEQYINHKKALRYRDADKWQEAYDFYNKNQDYKDSAELKNILYEKLCRHDTKRRMQYSSMNSDWTEKDVPTKIVYIIVGLVFGFMFLLFIYAMLNSLL